MSSELLNAMMGAQYKAKENPFGIAAQSIAGNAGNLINPYGSVGSNAAATIGAALLAGLLGGVAKSQTETDNADLEPLFKQVLTATPEQRSELVKQNSRLSPIVAALTAQEQARAQELAQKRQELALSRESKTLEIPIDVAKENALLGNYEAKQQIKGKYDPSAPKIDLGLGKQLPAATIGEISDSKVIADEATRIASELEKGAGANDLKTWIKIQGAKTFSGLDESGVQTELANLADKVLRSRSGSAAPYKEQAKLQQIIAGDFTASPKQMASLLRKFAAAESRGIKSKLELANTLATGSTTAFQKELDSIISAAQPQNGSQSVVMGDLGSDPNNPPPVIPGKRRFYNGASWEYK